MGARISNHCDVGSTYPGDGSDVSAGDQEEPGNPSGVGVWIGREDRRADDRSRHLRDGALAVEVIMDASPVARTNGPIIHRGRFPVMSDMKPQAKSVTIVTRLAQAGMTLRCVTLYPFSPGLSQFPSCRSRQRYADDSRR